MKIKEFNLSEMRMSANDYISYIWYDEEDVKEFIKRDNDLINKFILGEIDLVTLRKRRRKLIGKKLIPSSSNVNPDRCTCEHERDMHSDVGCWEKVDGEMCKCRKFSSKPSETKQ